MKDWLYTFSIFSWRDFFEILFCSGTFYALVCWFKRDTQKPLLAWFLSYCTLIVGAYYLYMPTMHTFLLLSAPVAALIFLIIHQETLQKNFIALHMPASIAKPLVQNWPELLVKTALVAAGDQKSFGFIIEKNDALETFLASSSIIMAPASEPLFKLLLHSSSYSSQDFFWIGRSGTIVAVNTKWSKNSIDTWMTQEVKDQPAWIKDAIFFSSKTDVLIGKVNPTTRTFTLITQGKLVDNTSAHATVRFIKQYYGLFTPAQKGDTYAHDRQAKNSEQSLS